MSHIYFSVSSALLFFAVAALGAFTKLAALTYAWRLVKENGAAGVTAVTRHMSIVRDFIHFEEASYESHR